MAKRKAKMDTDDEGKTNFINFNRVLHKSDYDVFGVTTRKGWEIEIALKTLREFGVVHKDAMILGVGAATERTIFELSRDVKFVFATDKYCDMGTWADWSGTDFLADPAKYAPDNIDFDVQRIIPQHMDMMYMNYPDNTFDGVFSSGSIEHVGKGGQPDYLAIARAAREIGRVVKPGGILSLSTEWKLAGDGWGWGHVRLFDEALIYRHIIEPSGCELIDEPDWSFDGDLNDAVELRKMVMERFKPDVEYVLKEHQFTFTSVHLAMRKPE